MSKYGAIKAYLRNSQKQKETLTYKDIEDMVGGKLPSSAYKHRAFWANSRERISGGWNSMGWMTGPVKLGKTITFQKVRDTKTARKVVPSSKKGKVKSMGVPQRDSNVAVSEMPIEVPTMAEPASIEIPAKHHPKIGIHPEAVNIPRIIRELHQLVRDGIITEGEFKAKKDELLKSI
ncbi:MAG: SHOCT domain-containing protein [Euryarchaeota archaeon]|nr:SHOCT domain-containing protein [Euryarchaeota archaeon]